MALNKGRKPAKDDDTDDQDDVVDETEVDGDEDGTEDDGWEAPKTKADFDRMMREAGNSEAKKWRLRAMGRDKSWTSPKGGDTTTKTTVTKDDGEEQTPEQIRAAARNELEAEYATKAEENNLRAQVSVSLMSAGLALSDEEMKSPAAARRAVSRVVNMLDLKSLTLDSDTGEVDGLDDEIADLRRSYPGLFKAGTGGRAATTRGADGAPRGGSKGPAKDPVEELAAAWFGGK